MARGRGRGKGRPRRETILTLGSANGARLEPEVQKEVTLAATLARGTLTEPTPIYATDVFKQLHLSTRATTSKTEPVIAIMQQEGEVSTNETVIRAPLITTTEKGKAPVESWANLFAKNRSVTNGIALSYILPQVIDGIIQLDKIGVARETVEWKCAMIVYALGESPGYNTMHRYISQTWTKIVTPEIFMHEEGYFINWTEDFYFDQEFPTKISIWVKFPNLPMNCWGCDSLSRIASAIEISIFAYECTTKQTRIYFARMLVEVDVTKPLP
ncbi:hypothetical protein R3W88_001695 [Solanum pinnatisectum]|uniref:DUF4283 domain-containing protein n=1 Tax=Solanum pinnatisectum TaxID=50273 RepID=A0AAV9MKD7_9SOLN|nr:hypothetical protein R3W88_001695 [Solanum pinnatisectum]